MMVALFTALLATASLVLLVEAGGDYGDDYNPGYCLGGCSEVEEYTKDKEVKTLGDLMTNYCFCASNAINIPALLNCGPISAFVENDMKTVTYTCGNNTIIVTPVQNRGGHIEDSFGGYTGYIYTWQENECIIGVKCSPLGVNVVNIVPSKCSPDLCSAANSRCLDRVQEVSTHFHSGEVTPLETPMSAPVYK